VDGDNSSSRASGQGIWRRYLTNGLLLLASVLFALLVGEGIIRTMQPQSLGNWTYTRDGLTLHLPNTTQFSYKFGHQIVTNSVGMRDREHNLTKLPGVYRILVLGDSFMEANQVKFEYAFVSLLEQRLKEAADQPIEVINASVSGWGTDDELVYFMREGIKYRPDLVLVAMTLHNDVSDNLREEYHEFKNGRIQERPVMLMPRGPFIVLKMKEWMASHSHLYHVVLRAKRANWVSTEARNLNSHVGGLLRRKSDDSVRAGWEMTKQLLQKIRQVADTINAPVAVVLLPLSIQVYPEKVKDFLVSNSLKPIDIDLFKPQEMMKVIGKNIGVAIIDLFPVFRDTKAKCNCALFVPDDGHWNNLGHQIAAEEVARNLTRAGFSERAMSIRKPVR
jgi:lysophospholipase L1-like esterase